MYHYNRSGPERQGSSKVTRQSDAGRLSRLTSHQCVAMLGALKGCGHPTKPRREASIFIQHLFGSAGAWMPFNSRLIILDGMFQSQIGGRRGQSCCSRHKHSLWTFCLSLVVSIHTWGLFCPGNASTWGITNDSYSGCLNTQSHPGEMLVRPCLISPGREYAQWMAPLCSTEFSDLIEKDHFAESLQEEFCSSWSIRAHHWDLRTGVTLEAGHQTTQRIWAWMEDGSWKVWACTLAILSSRGWSPKYISNSNVDAGGPGTTLHELQILVTCLAFFMGF